MTHDSYADNKVTRTRPLANDVIGTRTITSSTYVRAYRVSPRPILRVPQNPRSSFSLAPLKIFSQIQHHGREHIRGSNIALSNSSRNSPQPRQTAHALKSTVESRYKQRAPRPITDAHGYRGKPYSSCHRRLIDLGRHPPTIIGKCSSIAGAMCI